jgi:hypothetical protein
MQQPGVGAAVEALHVHGAGGVREQVVVVAPARGVHCATDRAGQGRNRAEGEDGAGQGGGGEIERGPGEREKERDRERPWRERWRGDGKERAGAFKKAHPR